MVFFVALNHEKRIYKLIPQSLLALFLGEKILRKMPFFLNKISPLKVIAKPQVKTIGIVIFVAPIVGL